MITLTRLNGATFALNDQLVERIEANPDTVVVLVDGKKFIVAEPVAEVVEQIRQARADVAIRSAMVEVVEDPGPDLRLINGAGGRSHHHRPMTETPIEGDDRQSDPDPEPKPDHKPGHAKEGTPWIQ